LLLSKLGIADDPVMIAVLIVTYAAPTANNQLLMYAPYEKKVM
jgi:hypothetical protein